MKTIVHLRPVSMDAQLPQSPRHYAMGVDDVEEGVEEVAAQLKGVRPLQRSLLIGLRQVGDVCPADVCAATNGQRYRDRLIFATEEYWIVACLLRYLDARRIRPRGTLRLLLHMPDGRIYFPIIQSSGGHAGKPSAKRDACGHCSAIRSTLFGTSKTEFDGMTYLLPSQIMGRNGNLKPPIQAALFWDEYTNVPTMVARLEGNLGMGEESFGYPSSED